MASPALVDLWSSVLALPLRQRIVGVARLMMGTPYQLGNKSAFPIDGIAGITGGKIDCSGFVRNVFDQVFPGHRLRDRFDLNAASFQANDLFVDTEKPLPGDIVCWNGHVGIVYDNVAQTFIGSQTSTGVNVASYAQGYWATTKPVQKFRKWKTL
jgi:cell wall-associated NlpC family hydrolase